MKNWLLVLIVIVFPFLVKAQQSEVKKVRLGFTLTPNTGWLRFKDSNAGEANGGRFGFSYGILGDFSLASNNNYYFSTAFALTTINGKASETANSPAGAVGNSVYKLQYIEVPLTLKLKSNPTASGRFYGQFGFGTGIKISAKRDFTPGLTNSDAPAEDNANISSKVNIFRLGLIAGAGAEWNLDRNLAIQTGLTFNNGFTDIFDGRGNARNSYLALNLGIFF